jgi:uncharacterized membrane protein
MTALVLAALLWVAVHVGIAGTAIRAGLAARLGEGGFRAAFSLLSVISIALLVMAWQAAPLVILWDAPPWLGWLIVALMLPAFWLFVASVVTPNPTAVGGRLAESGARGIQRITRHPMLWSFSIWAALHILAKGNLAGLIFFGAFLVTSLVGMPSIDRKLAAGQPLLWARLAPATSILPFGAILAGRNGLALDEIPPLVWIVGTLAWAAMLWLHPSIFGWPALPPP